MLAVVSVLLSKIDGLPSPDTAEARVLSPATCWGLGGLPQPQPSAAWAPSVALEQALDLPSCGSTLQRVYRSAVVFQLGVFAFRCVKLLFF